MAELFSYNKPFTLESGHTFNGYHLAYTTYGTLNQSRDNAVWIFHALTANSDPAEWWPGLVGEGKLFDPSSYFIVCVNMPGSCYGSIGPLDEDGQTGSPYYHTFPFFTTITTAPGVAFCEIASSTILSIGCSRFLLFIPTSSGTVYFKRDAEVL